MATLVTSFRKHANIYIFRTNMHQLYVESFENGTAKIISPFYQPGFPETNSNFRLFVETIVNCFDKDSNFKKVLFKAFNCSKDTIFTDIQIEYCYGVLLVNKDNLRLELIYNSMIYVNALNVRYLHKSILDEEIAEYQESVRNLVSNVDNSSDFIFKDGFSNNTWNKTNDITEFAQCWAKYMQYLMKTTGKTISEIADESTFPFEIEYFVGFKNVCAVAFLAHYWKYGEELLKWHNEKWNDEDDAYDEYPDGLLTIRWI